MDTINNLTYEKIYKILKEFSIRHKKINTFIFDMNNQQSEDIVYPLMYVKPGNITLMNGEEQYTYTIAFLTKENGDNIDCMNDMQLLTEQFFNFFHEINWDFSKISFPNESNLVLSPTIKNSDKAIGYATTLILKGPKNIYQSETPIDWTYTSDGQQFFYPELPPEFATIEYVNSINSLIYLNDVDSSGLTTSGQFLSWDKDTSTFKVNLLYDDLMLPLTTGKQGALDKPDYDFTNNGFLFPANNINEKIYMMAQMPHSYKEGTDIHPHIHWEQDSSSAIVWEMSYKWINRGADASVAWTSVSSSDNRYTYSGGKLHQKTDFGVINGTGKTISSMLHIVINRNDNLTTNRTNNDALAWQFDIHYLKDKPGTLTY